MLSGAEVVSRWINVRNCNKNEIENRAGIFFGFLADLKVV
jgi:hypothetical protein